MTNAPRNIILVGFMASGKTSVGRALSERTGWPLTDADDEIVRRAGKPISQIFADSGEAGFREIERAVITGLCQTKGRIVSAGGGAFVSERNRSAMLNGGIVFWLAARPETIYERLTHEDTAAAVRPLLAVADPMARIESLLGQRAPAYAKAHHTIDTDGVTPEGVAGRVLKLLSDRRLSA
jgi:shikimate kinase